MKTLTFAALLFTVGLGCSAGQMDPGEKLRNDVTHFNQALRWKHFDKAAKFLPKDTRDDILEQWRAEQDDVRILEVDVERVKRLGRTRADVTVRYMEVHTSSNVVRTHRQLQQWKYGEDRKWRVLELKDAKPKKRRDW